MRTFDFVNNSSENGRIFVRANKNIWASGPEELFNVGHFMEVPEGLILWCSVAKGNVPKPVITGNISKGGTMTFSYEGTNYGEDLDNFRSLGRKSQLALVSHTINSLINDEEK
jgi:hypothetical protein